MGVLTDRSGQQGRRAEVVAPYKCSIGNAVGIVKRAHNVRPYRGLMQAISPPISNRTFKSSRSAGHHNS